MGFLAYFKFLPLLISLIEFIKAAEAEFKTPDSGGQKAQWVVDHFLPIVAGAGSAGLIPQKLVDAITGGIDAIIAVIVQIMNATGGVTPAPLPVPVPAPTPTPDPTALRYATLEAAKANVTPNDPIVLLYSDGQYGVWAVVGPFPAGSTKVYP